jgi:hypothetical protein
LKDLVDKYLEVEDIAAKFGGGIEEGALVVSRK